MTILIFIKHSTWCVVNISLSICTLFIVHSQSTVCQQKNDLNNLKLNLTLLVSPQLTRGCPARTHTHTKRMLYHDKADGMTRRTDTLHLCVTRQWFNQSAEELLRGLFFVSPSDKLTCVSMLNSVVKASQPATCVCLCVWERVIPLTFIVSPACLKTNYILSWTALQRSNPAGLIFLWITESACFSMRQQLQK